MMSNLILRPYHVGTTPSRRVGIQCHVPTQKLCEIVKEMAVQYLGNIWILYLSKSTNTTL